MLIISLIAAASGFRRRRRLRASAAASRYDAAYFRRCHAYALFIFATLTI